MHPQITFTLDLEDHRPNVDAPIRYPEVTRDLLARLAELDVLGTVFVVGELAVASPDLVSEVAALGHEIALHGLRHVPLPEIGREDFATQTREGKARLEDITGREVVGFRAPMFSLVAESRWAVDVLLDQGFAYSSSVLPARSPLFGDPSVPAHPFLWPGGLVELPCPVARVGPVNLPFLGGVYLRALPWPLVRALLARRRSDELLWTYCHPYDFDPGEPYWVVPEAGRAGSRLLWYGRGRTFDRISGMLAGRAGGPLAGRAATIAPTLATHHG